MSVRLAPSAQVLLGYLGVVVASVVALTLFSGEFSAIVLVPMAALIGPSMLITYPFGPVAKLAWSCVLLICVATTYVGWRKRQSDWGPVVAIIGLCAWTLVGLIGLGTRTCAFKQASGRT